MFHWVVLGLFLWVFSSGISNFLSKCIPLNLVYDANYLCKNDFQALVSLSKANRLMLPGFTSCISFAHLFNFMNC